MILRLGRYEGTRGRWRSVGSHIAIWLFVLLCTIPGGEEGDKEQATNIGVSDDVLGHQEEAIARLDELALQLAPPCDTPVTRIIRTILVDAFEVEDRSSRTEEEDEVCAHKRTGRTPGQQGRGHCLSPHGDMGHARLSHCGVSGGKAWWKLILHFIIVDDDSTSRERGSGCTSLFCLRTSSCLLPSRRISLGAWVGRCLLPCHRDCLTVDCSVRWFSVMTGERMKWNCC